MLNKIALVGMLVFIALPVQAHLDAGEDVTVGKYVIDFGYSPETPKTDEPVEISFLLLTSNSEEVPFEELAITAFLEEKPKFKASYFPESGEVSFSHRFEESGTYRLEAKFKDNLSNVIAENSFDLPISEDNSSIDIRLLFYALSVILLVFLVIKSKLFDIPKIRKKT